MQREIYKSDKLCKLCILLPEFITRARYRSFFFIAFFKKLIFFNQNDFIVRLSIVRRQHYLESVTGRIFINTVSAGGLGRRLDWDRQALAAAFN